MKQREKRNPKKRDRKKQIDDDVVHHDDLGFPSSSQSTPLLPAPLAKILALISRKGRRSQSLILHLCGRVDDGLHGSGLRGKSRWREGRGRSLRLKDCWSCSPQALDADGEVDLERKR